MRAHGWVNNTQQLLTSPFLSSSILSKNSLSNVSSSGVSSPSALTNSLPGQVGVVCGDSNDGGNAKSQLGSVTVSFGFRQHLIHSLLPLQ